MPIQNVNSKPLILLSTALSLQVASYIVVLFDIPVARQVLLFAYLTFVPGYLIVKLLRFSFESLEVLVFSVGFSVAFLMLVGLALNELGFVAGLLQPLSTIPMLIVLNNVILAIAIIAYLRNKASSLPRVSFCLLKCIVPLLVPLVLSVVGAIFVGVYGDNRLLLVMILAVSLVTALLTLKGIVPSVVYAFAVFIIGVSLLFHSLLVSRYITTFGSDVALELFVLKNTLKNNFWSSVPLAYCDVGLGRLNSLLSITVLPTVCSNLMGLDSTWVFKVVYPIIFAFVPLCVYQLWRKSFGSKWAFVSAFFFMATATFYTELLGLNRQMIAELFFALLLFVLLDKRLSRLQRIVSFTFFGFGLVVSHYGLAEIFLFLIVFALVYLLVFKRRSNNLTVGMVISFFVIMFAWYIYTSRASVFESFLDSGEYIYQQLGEFFNPASRGKTVLRGLGLESPPTVWNAMSRFFAYATEFLIVVGFVSFLFKRKNATVGTENFILICEAMGLLAALIIVPGLANTMNMTRFYHVLLFFLAPLCVLGAKFLKELILKGRSEKMVSALLLLVLVPYYLFQSGFVYEVVKNESWSISLSGYRMYPLRLYYSGVVDDYSVYCARGFSRMVYDRTSKVYVDYISWNYILTIYCDMASGNYILSNVTILDRGDIIYLSKLNIVDGLLFDGKFSWNCSEICLLFEPFDIVYDNGGSKVYVKR